jgi:bifunctional pyridoxal-dependent enzyme with beta-cystathionase and maltose regulon repressor activities
MTIFNRSSVGCNAATIGPIQKENISVRHPGVVSAIHACLMAYTQVGDAVMIQKPVYHPFANAINKLETQTRQ